jgi:Family of unknown function (DUF5985)
MAEAVYVLCALTSITCSWLLLRSFAHTGVRLLLWSGLCFAGLALNNIVLFVDKVVAPDSDLSLVRLLPALAGLLLLLFGLIWESAR